MSEMWAWTLRTGSRPLLQAQRFSVKIFVPASDPEGLHVIEKSNWTGQGIVFPRSLFAEVRHREELNRTGVYVLWGPGQSGQLPRAYMASHVGGPSSYSRMWWSMNADDLPPGEVDDGRQALELIGLSAHFFVLRLLWIGVSIFFPPLRERL